MMETIKTLLADYFNFIMISGIALTGFVIFTILFNKPKKVLAPLIMEVVLIAAYIFSFYYTDGITNKIIYLACYGLLAFTFIFSFIVTIVVHVEKSKINLIIKSSSTVDSAILVYLNEKGKIIYPTDDFLKFFEVEKFDELEQQIKYVHLDELQMSYEGFIKFLGEEIEDDYNFTFDLVNAKEKNIALSKRKLISRGRLLGYVITQKKEEPIDLQAIERSKLESINLVNEALAIYESDTNKFLLNRKMQNLLGVETVTNFDDYIFIEDKKQIEKRSKLENNRSRIYYRINGQTARVWVLEISTIIDNKLTRIIRETNFDNLIYQFRDFSRLQTDLQKLITSQNDFALVTVSLHSLSQIKDKIGKDAAMVLATQYFVNINNEIRDLKVYEVGFYKFSFYMKDDQIYRNMLRDLHNNNSKLLKTKVMFNDLIFEIKSHVGIVESKGFPLPTPELLISYCDSALELASNKNYNKDFSIYIPKRREVKTTEKDIDLSDSFIENIMN